MTFRRLLNLRLLRQLAYYSSSNTSQFIPSKHVNRLGIAIGALSFGSAVLLYEQAKCATAEDSEKQTVPRRLQRFLSFASAEFQGCVYMTPQVSFYCIDWIFKTSDDFQDLLDSLVLDQPRGLCPLFN